MPSGTLSTAAVRVIDVQRGCYGAEPPPHHAAGTLRRINRVTRAARGAGRPVIFIQHDDPDRSIPESDAWQLHPDLEQAAGDHYVRKTTCDAFPGTGLDKLLRAAGVDPLVLTGCATEFCVDSTLQNAASRGHRIVVISDGHTTRDRPVLRAGQIKAHHNWVWENLICRPGVSLLKAEDVTFA